MKIRHANAEYTDAYVHMATDAFSTGWQICPYCTLGSHATRTIFTLCLHGLFVRLGGSVWTDWAPFPFRVPWFSLFWFPYISSSSTLLTQDQKRILGTRVPRGLSKHLNESIRLEDFRKYLINRFETEIFQHYEGIVYSFQLKKRNPALHAAFKPWIIFKVNSQELHCALLTVTCEQRFLPGIALRICKVVFTSSTKPTTLLTGNANDFTNAKSGHARKKPLLAGYSLLSLRITRWPPWTRAF